MYDRMTLCVAGILLAAVPALQAVEPASRQVTASVLMVDTAFIPGALNITIGDTVVWTNNGARSHTSTSDDGLWDSGALAPGQSFSFTFTTVGAFVYRSTLDGAMAGTVTVAAPTSPPAITSSSSAVATTGLPFSYTITATNFPTSFAATGLPPGVLLNVSTGIISGTPVAPGVFNVGLSATNARGTTNASLVLTVTNPPLPVITSALSAAATVGQPFSYSIGASGSPTSFSAIGLPPGLQINGLTGVVSGTPLSAGTSGISLGATNATGTGSATLVLTVSNPLPPVITSALNAAAFTGAPFSYTIAATNTPTGFTATGLPAGLQVNANTGLIFGTPTVAGTSSVFITAANAGGTGSATLILTVSNPLPPVINSVLAATASTGQPFSYTISATNTPTRFDATGLPAGLRLDPDTGLISGTPTTAGTSGIFISATNAGGTGTATLTLIVVTPPPPVITSVLAAEATTGQPFIYNITASNSPLSFNATGLPAGLRVDPDTGLISGTPESVGTSSIALLATNTGGTGTATLVLRVSNPPPPVITSPLAASATTGQAFSYTITATNQPTLFSAAELPPGLRLDPATGIISGTPLAAGLSGIPLSASNTGGTATATLRLTVNNPPPPEITSTLIAEAALDTAFTYSIAASNTPTRFDASGLPPGLQLNTDTGVISGTPSATGSFSVVLSASNAGGTGTATLSLTVVLPAPVIDSAPTALATVGQPFNYVISAAFQPSTFNATGLPPGLFVDPTTGLITGVPSLAGAVQITLEATNTSGTGTAPLRLTIARPAGAQNTPPLVSSGPSVSPSLGLSGEAVFLTVAASDPDGDLLLYSWDFGDGTSGVGSSVSHIYAAAGLFIAEVTVTDGEASDIRVLSVPINDPGSEPATLQRASIKFNFARRKRDRMLFSGTLPIARGFSAKSKTAVVSIGEFSASFVLNGHGTASNKSGRFALRRRGGAGTSAVFTFSSSRLDLSERLAGLGFADADVIARPVQVVAIITLDNHSSLAPATLLYSATQNKAGLARK